MVDRLRVTPNYSTYFPPGPKTDMPRLYITNGVAKYYPCHPDDDHHYRIDLPLRTKWESSKGHLHDALQDASPSPPLRSIVKPRAHSAVIVDRIICLMKWGILPCTRLSITQECILAASPTLNEIESTDYSILAAHKSWGR